MVSEDGTHLAPPPSLASTEGLHHVFVHSKDSLGLWGPPLDIDAAVDKTGPAVDAASVGPNPTNAVLADKSNPGYLLVSAQITDRDAGGALQSPSPTPRRSSTRRGQPGRWHRPAADRRSTASWTRRPRRSTG